MINEFNSGYDRVAECDNCGWTVKKNFMSNNYAYTQVTEIACRHKCEFPPLEEIDSTELDNSISELGKLL